MEGSLEQRQADAAAAGAAGIGGVPNPDGAVLDEDGEPVDEAHRPLAEAGQGTAEGFELTEQELVDHASHGDQHAARRVIEDVPEESDDERASGTGESDSELSSETDE